MFSLIFKLPWWHIKYYEYVLDKTFFGGLSRLLTIFSFLKVWAFKVRDFTAFCYSLVLYVIMAIERVGFPKMTMTQDLHHTAVSNVNSFSYNYVKVILTNDHWQNASSVCCNILPSPTSIHFTSLWDFLFFVRNVTKRTKQRSTIRGHRIGIICRPVFGPPAPAACMYIWSDWYWQLERTDQTAADTDMIWIFCYCV